MKKESTVLRVDELKHQNQLSDISLKQKHVLQVQNVKHILNLNFSGGKINGKIDTR